MTKRVDGLITEMESCARAVLDGTDGRDGLDVARALAIELNGKLNYLRESLQNGASADQGAYWMAEVMQCYEELRFTLPDDDARTMGLGGAHAPYADGVEQAARHGRKYWKRQREQSSRANAARWASEERDWLAEIITQLARRRDELGDPLPPAELWDSLYGEMDDAGLAPRTTSNGALNYEGDKGTALTYEAFRKRVIRLRK